MRVFRRREGGRRQAHHNQPGIVESKHEMNCALTERCTNQRVTPSWKQLCAGGPPWRPWRRLQRAARLRQRWWWLPRVGRRADMICRRKRRALNPTPPNPSAHATRAALQRADAKAPRLQGEACRITAYRRCRRSCRHRLFAIEKASLPRNCSQPPLARPPQSGGGGGGGGAARLPAVIGGRQNCICSKRILIRCNGQVRESCRCGRACVLVRARARVRACVRADAGERAQARACSRTRTRACPGLPAPHTRA